MSQMQTRTALMMMLRRSVAAGGLGPEAGRSQACHSAAPTAPDGATSAAEIAAIGGPMQASSSHAWRGSRPTFGAHASFSTSSSSAAAPTPIQWVFLGAPGVGKGTYASRAAKHFGAAHIATGDLIRGEIQAGTALGKQVSGIVNQGALVPDDLVFEILERRLESGRQAGERGFILDGFPRTRAQAEKLYAAHALQVAFNLSLREEVLIEKCLGRRQCSHCGKGYNVADIHLPASGGRPEIVMPPLSPPPKCAPHLETREDDTEPVIRKRLESYRAQAGPVEAFFRERGLLCDFEITAGIPETLPRLLKTLEAFVPKQ